MIDDHWIDLTYYNIQFRDINGRLFNRIIVLPLNFEQKNIIPFFYFHFGHNVITVYEVTELGDAWISKHIYSQIPSNLLESRVKELSCLN